ncbi:DNA adenine methylase [Shouchella clausii]|uniref:DNA methyltransferase n=1 Tax=Shouchella clausii TaxID=79880 RepID=A0A268P599_SHOCL|nr:DNA adenine methylase [Shouchella clausii]PAE90916.1 DNA methyltransferase [Shouchella clausii]
MSSPLIWFGGKGKVAKYIIQQMTDHKVYVEPFGGAAHVISQKPRVSHEVYNDIDFVLVNFMLQARDNTSELIDAVSTLPYSRELYEKWKREELPTDPLERAVRFFYLNRCGISKGNVDAIPKTGWRHSTKSNQNPAKGYLAAAERIAAFAKRMMGVQIECGDYLEIIKKYDSEETLFYLDPPYVGKERYYAGGFGQADHEVLAETLNGIKGKAIISYYADPLIDDLYKGWAKDTYTATRQIVGDKTSERTEELLLMNYGKEISLFDFYEEETVC